MYLKVFCGQQTNCNSYPNFPHIAKNLERREGDQGKKERKKKKKERERERERERLELQKLNKNFLRPDDGRTFSRLVNLTESR